MANQTKTSVYERVARNIEAQIRSRTLRPGDRLPSLRKAHAQTGASLTSIMRAYVLLENEGLIESRPQSGFYVRPHRLAPPPSGSTGAAPQPIDELVMASFIRATTDATAISLAEAVPCPGLLPTKTLVRILGRACRARPETLLRFEHPQGNPELRRELSKRSLTAGRGYAADDVVITNGGVESWNLCLRAVTKPGDTVLVEAATYFGVKEILKSLALTAVELPSDPGQLELLLRDGGVRACLVMPNFAKPFVAPLGDAEKRALVATLTRYRIPVIEDDVYGDLALDGGRPPTLKDFDDAGLVLHCGSFSKTVSPGFRVSWIAPGRYKDEVVRLKFLTSMASPTLAQTVLAEYLARGSFDRHLRRIRRTLVAQLTAYETRVRRYFPPGTRVSIPAAGFALWVQLPDGGDAIELYRAALSENILLAPGPVFSPTGALRDFIRLSFGSRCTPRVDQALARIGRLAHAVTGRKSGNSSCP